MIKYDLQHNQILQPFQGDASRATFDKSQLLAHIVVAQEYGMEGVCGIHDQLAVSSAPVWACRV